MHRELRGEKRRGTREEYICLVSICREVLSTMAGKSKRISKLIRVRKIPELTVRAARNLGARLGCGDVGDSVLALNDRASRIQCCVVPCLDDPEGMKVPRSARKNASALHRGKVLWKVGSTAQGGYVSCSVPCYGGYYGGSSDRIMR